MKKREMLRGDKERKKTRDNERNKRKRKEWYREGRLKEMGKRNRKKK